MNVPGSFLSTLKAGFFSLVQTGLETALLAGRPHRRQRLWMFITGAREERYEPDIAATPRARNRKLLPTRAMSLAQAGQIRAGLFVSRSQ